MPPKMSVLAALSVLQAHAKEFSGFVIDEHLAKVADAVSRGFLESVMDETLARATVAVWDFCTRQARQIEVLRVTGHHGHALVGAATSCRTFSMG